MGPRPSQNRIISFFKSLRYKNLLLPYLQSIVLAVLIPLTVISLWFFLHVYNTMARNVQESNQQSVERFCIDLRATLNDMDGLAFKFVNIAAFYPAAYKRDPLSALNTFKLYRDINHKYDDVMILYKDIGQVMTTHGINGLELFYPGLPERDALLKDLFSSTSSGFFNTVAYGAVQEEAELLYVRALPPVASPKHFALFVLSDEKLRAGVTLAYSGAQEETQVILDEGGNALWASRSLTDEALAFVGRVAAGSADRDKVVLGGKEYFYAVGSISHGLFFLRMATSTEGMLLMRTTLVYFALCCLMILLGGVVVMRLAVRRGYRPLKQMVDAISEGDAQRAESGRTELETLRSAIARGAFLMANMEGGPGQFTMEQLRSMFVLNAIQGRHTSPEELENIKRNLQIRLTANYYFVCCILAEPRSHENLREAVINQIRTSGMENVPGYFYVGLDGRTTVGILMASSPDLSERYVYGKRLLGRFSDEWNVTVSVGNAYQDFARVSTSYLEARMALDYRFIRGSRTVIAADELPEEASGEYPKLMLQEFAGRVRAWNVHAINSQLAAILQYIQTRHLPLHQARCICFELASVFLKEAGEVNQRAANSLQDVCDIFSLSEYGSIADLAATIELLSMRISAFVKENSARKDCNFVKECMGQLNANLGNGQFSLETMAEGMGISPQYLRKRFKELAGRTLSDALNDMRIARAKELLLTTEYDITAIIAQIGYTDVSSFIRKFKNAVGLPPGKFREQYKGKS